MPLKTEVLLRYANGYRILGMFEDAEKELAKIPPEELEDDHALTMKLALFQDWEKWDSMQEVAHLLRERHPDNSDWWIAEAFATRRCRSLDEARKVLLEGERIHPEEPCLLFNLGCYACVSGELEEALGRVRSAIALDPKYRALALEDEDLRLVRDELR